MRLVISLEKKARISVDVRNGEEVFRDLSGHLLNKAVGENKSPYAPGHVSVKPHKDLQNTAPGIPESFRENFLEAVEKKIEPQEGPTEERREDTQGEKEVGPIHKTLVITKCKQCGKISIIPLQIQNGKALVHGGLVCKNCGSELDVSDLHYGKAECADCGHSIFFYAAGNEDLEINCKNCGSPLDLLYNENKKEFRSANLFGIKGGK
ncbi:MAG: hypothetical protein LKE46_01695 [Clostridium sp.]|uniref:hypothetical protein n=1 Tax=Clostridium sp. TaxID=1506 RepID=UPI0025BAED85|nr:hypothetical protein [Clostridium sp.]MCH3962963.1 hypothetical protein [Clostridium sp.]MCI1800172.1 hypothetical protein [Clostridium sp.]MCI2200167.1 hypothetical protein [Clostridium sp.]